MLVKMVKSEKQNIKNTMHTFTEKVGIVNEVVSYMKNADNQAALTAKNFDVAPHIARLQAEGAGSAAHPVDLRFAERELHRLQ